MSDREKIKRMIELDKKIGSHDLDRLTRNRSWSRTAVKEFQKVESRGGSQGGK